MIALVDLADVSQGDQHVLVAPAVPNTSKLRARDGTYHLTKLVGACRLLANITVVRVVPCEQLWSLGPGHPARCTTPVDNVEGTHDIQAMGLHASISSLANVPGLSCKSRAQRGFCQLQTFVGQPHAAQISSSRRTSRSRASCTIRDCGIADVSAAWISGRNSRTQFRTKTFRSPAPVCEV